MPIRRVSIHTKKTKSPAICIGSTCIQEEVQILQAHANKACIENTGPIQRPAEKSKKALNESAIQNASENSAMFCDCNSKVVIRQRVIHNKHERLIFAIQQDLAKAQGITLRCINSDKEKPTYIVSRWEMTKRLSTLAAVARWLRRVSRATAGGTRK